MATILDETDRLTQAVKVIKRLGKYRAIEASAPNVPPTPNPLGEGFTGVDYDRGSYRARIGVADALDGRQLRVTLGRSDNAEDAVWLYRVAHVALYGSYSWAVDMLSDSERTLIELTRNATINN